MASRLIIRAEDKNIWERRTPLVPDHVRNLVRDYGFSIGIEPSSLRYFSNDRYVDAGAELVTSASPGDIVIGVKEIPTEKIERDMTYLYFSHTIKGQSANMGMLRKIIESGSTLLDYERIVDDANRRLIFFGKFAGDAGAVDILWLIGRELQRRGIASPLSQIRQSLAYTSVADAIGQITDIGREIGRTGFPDILQPFVVGVFGYGNVSRGAQEILSCFPINRLSPHELLHAHREGKLDPRLLHLVEFREEHLVRRSDGTDFNLQDYYQHPERYEPITEPYLPCFTLIVNAVYWNRQYPRFVTKAMVKRLWAAKKPSFLAISDISCDFEGAVELTVKTTDPGSPAFFFLPESGTIQDEPTGDGILILAVDNLPCEFAYDASLFFSTLLEKFIPPLLQADFSLPLADTGLPPELQRAVIVQRGHLTPAFRYLEQHLR